MHHCSFLFCIPDSCALSLCFLSTITSFLHCIVSSIVWRNVYKDSVHPLVKQGKTYSSKFSSVQSSQAQYQWYKLIVFTCPLMGKKRNSLFFFLSTICSSQCSLLKRVLPSIHLVSSSSHNHPLSIPFSLSIYLFSSHTVVQSRVRQKADWLYIRPVGPEDTTPTPPIYIEHPNLFTRIPLQVENPAILLRKSLPPNKCVTYRLQEDRCAY